MKLKPKWKYWTTDLPFVEGKSVLHDEPLPPNLINRAGWIFTDDAGDIVKPELGPVHKFGADGQAAPGLNDAP